MKLFDTKNIIKIEKDDLQDAKLSSADFLDDAIKQRAFINVLGARLGINMLFSKKIKANNVYSLYTIYNVLREVDVADVYLDGIKIDVRLVFNRNEIFIPKSHFEYGLTPDVYLVLEINKDFSSAEILGFFEPEDIDKQNQNADFYFHPCEKLNDAKDIKSFLKKYNAKSSLGLPDEDFEKAENLFLSLIDNSISKEDKLFLFKSLASDFDLREKIIEFENFELIAAQAAKSEEIIKDEVLDIVGSQKLYEDEELSETEEKAEIIEEVLTDLLEEEAEEPEIVEEFEDISADLSGEVVEEVEAVEEISSDLLDEITEELEKIEEPEEIPEDLSAEIVEESEDALADLLEEVEESIEYVEPLEVEEAEEETIEISDELEIIDEEKEETFIEEEDIESKAMEDFEEVDFSAVETAGLDSEIQQDDLFTLPEINFEEKQENKEQIDKDGSEENVVSIDEFDFEMLKQNDLVDSSSAEAQEDFVEPEYLAMAKTEEFVPDEKLEEVQDIQEEYIQEPEEEQEPQKEPEQEIVESLPEEDFEKEEIDVTKAINLPSQEDLDYEDLPDESDQLISDVESTLQDIDLSDEQKALLEGALKEYEKQEQKESSDDNLDLVEDLFTDESVLAQTSHLEKLQKEADSTEQDIYSEEEEEEPLASSKELPFKDVNVRTLINKNKKLVIAASLAGIVFASVIAGNTLTKNKNTNLAQKEANVETQAPMEGQEMAPPQEIPGEGQQAAPNREIGQAISDAFLSEPISTSISKVAWEVPEDLAYNDGFRKYLQLAGKNLKLNLQNDLLLSTEMAYSNKIVIDLEISSDGSLKSETLVMSSGSKEIDKIVLQSVKNTLMYLKMPSSELNGRSATATLIINF